MSDYVSEDLIVEIFTRLPPKSLLRFRSLSKSVCRCISSPGFIRMHTSRSPQKVVFLHGDMRQISLPPIFTIHGEDELPFLLCPKRGYIGITTTTSFTSRPRFRPIGSCNGTFCLWMNGNTLTLWNSSIRRKLCLPDFPRSSQVKLGAGAIGFGFDPISDDYKVVWVSYKRDICSFVYAVKAGAWCEIASPKRQFSLLNDEDVCLNGVLHWDVFYYHIKSPNIRVSYILTFNLSTHVFGKIPSGPGPASPWTRIQLTTIQDSLAWISYRNREGDPPGELTVPQTDIVDGSWIWVWRDESWSPAFKLGTGNLIIRGVLQLQPQPNDNGDLLINFSGEGLQVYNPTGVRSRVVNFYAAFYFEGLLRCVETLHLLDIGGTVGDTA